MSVKFKFLGTCAVDFSPRLKTDLADRFDMNARRSSAAIINDRYLIDCGVHTLDSLRIAKIPLEGITDVFFTHLHDDHFKPEAVAKVAKSKKESLPVWVSPDGRIGRIENVSPVKLPKCEKTRVDENVFVTALPANHIGDGGSPRFLLFEIEGKSILYATDGAWVINESYNYLRGLKRPLDMLVLDCTSGESGWEYGIGDHNGIPMIRLMLPSFRMVGIIDDRTRVYITHIAPSLHKPHDEIVEIMKPLGVEVAYDGLEIEL